MPPNYSKTNSGNSDFATEQSWIENPVATRGNSRKSSTLQANPSETTMNNVMQLIPKSPQRRRRQGSLRWAKKVTEANCLRPLTAVAQEYAWGRIGSSSTVARMKEASDASFEIDEGASYAELWLGTHPSGMSFVSVPKNLLSVNRPDSLPSTVTGPDMLAAGSNFVNTNQSISLLEYVRSDPAEHMGHKDDDDLQFLLKILSVRKVLSIQAHPDKTLAERLHAEFPNVYKDPNHKPEMAIALSEKVRAMFGFRPLHEIAQHLREYPEFLRVVGPAAGEEVMQAAEKENARKQLQEQSRSHGLFVHKSNDNAVDQETDQIVKSALRKLFHDYITADDATVHKAIDDMLTRLRSAQEEGDNHRRPGTPTLLEDVPKLMFQLHEQFPGDCGVFAPLIFNIVQLSKGEALFIDANEPHAYISGEIIECMACSDNVVRAGLTPKLKDVPTLVNMLTYKTCRPETTYGEQIDACTTRYTPPVPDFCVEHILVPANERYEIANVNSPSVLLVIEGDAVLQQDNVVSLSASFGMSSFCSAGTAVTVIAGDYGVTLTRAFNNVFMD